MLDRFSHRTLVLLLLGATWPFVQIAAAAGRPEAADVSFTEVGKLLASQGNAADSFGYSCAIEGDTLIVGAFGDDDLGWNNSGSVNIFQRDLSGEWTEVAFLLAPDGEPGDHFGEKVALSGDWAMVGAYGEDDLGDQAGAVYVFERNTGRPDNWGFVAKLLANDGEAGDSFGDSIAIDAETLVIGAPRDDDLGNNAGAAYVFELDDGGSNTWVEVAKLTAFDGEALDAFGGSVDIDGDYLVVSATGDDDLGTAAGAVYLFDRNSGGIDNWGLVTKLLASDGQYQDGFGGGLSIDGETLAIGASGDDDPEDNRGAAYVFERDAGGPDNWGQVAKLTAIDGDRWDHFGISVALDGDSLAVGSYLDDDQGRKSGSAYVYGRDEGGLDAWGKVAKLIPSDGAELDLFGVALTLDGGTLAIGAYWDDDLGEDSGSVYLFSEITVDPALVVTGNCPGDVTFNFTGGTPLGQAALAFSQGIGDALIPGGLCDGTETGLDIVNLLGILPIDADGEVTLDATLSHFVCDLQLQVVDMVSCATSNVTTFPATLE